MRKLSKKWIGIITGAAAGICLIAGIAALALRVDADRAETIALNYTGGGEVVAREIESEGLWNEYKYTIVNGNSRYEIEIGGFGQIKEMEQGDGGYLYY